MSEYIAVTQEYISKDGDIVTVAITREEVVRCHACAHSIANGDGCGRWGDFIEVEPGGFCKWGEPREHESAEVWNQWSADDVTCSEEK